MKIKKDLIKLGHKNPQLRDDIKVVLSHLEKKARRKEANRRVENMMGGGWMFGPTQFAAEIINNEFYNAGFLPVRGLTHVEGGTAALLVTVETEGPSEPSEEKLTEVAEAIANRLSGVGFPGIKGEAFHIGDSPMARILLKQKI